MGIGQRYIMKYNNIMIKEREKRMRFNYGEELDKLLVKVSKMYYKENLSQLDISKKLLISRPDISRLLTLAKKRGIVNIYISEPSKDYSNIEFALEKKYGIKEVIIVSNESNVLGTKQNIGAAAAFYLDRVIKDNLKIGVSWGTTIQEMVRYLNPTRYPKNIEVYQLTGGISGTEVDMQAGELTRKISKTYGGKQYIMYAPAFVKDEKTKSAILSGDPDLLNTLNMARKCNINFVGIGPVRNSTNLLYKSFFTKADIEKLVKLGAVGDVCGRFFDKDGKTCYEQIDKRTIGVSLDDLKKAKYVVGIGGGYEKIEAINGALKGGIINVLITDEQTSKSLIKI